MTGQPVEDRLRAVRAEAAATLLAARRRRDGLRDDRASTVSDDEHDPEGSTLSHEWTLAQAQVEAAEAAIVAVDDALSRLATGRYGNCVACGRPISAARLEALPTAELCIDCARRRPRGRTVDS